MTKKSSSLLKTLIITIGVFLLLTIAVFFMLRNTLLQKVLDKVADRLKIEYNTDFTYSHAAFNGLAGVELTGISIVPEGKDTLLYAASVQTSIRLRYALLFDFRLKELIIEHGKIQLVKNDSSTNIDCFLKREKVETLEKRSTEEPAKSNYAKTAYKIISKILAQIPGKVLLNNCKLSLTEDGKGVLFLVNNLSLENEKLYSEVDVHAESFKQCWALAGTANPRYKQADVQLYRKDSGSILIPYIAEKFNLQTGFDTIRFNLASVELDDDVLKVNGAASISHFMINHPKISKKDVVIENAEVQYQFVAENSFFALDSSSVVRFNDVVFHPFVQFENNPDTVIRVSITIPRVKAQDFISSLPEGLFTHFKGMEAQGEFEYRMDFVYNENKPQDLVFESNLQKYGFAIQRYGEANLSKLNTDFIYTPIEYGRPQRPILISLSNPNYTTLDNISLFLQKSVLTTEDPSFFYHRGFIDEAFRQSIIKNLRTRKFARGASTISMQLVKNVFLTREKTLSRKAEEILLVYILENNRLCSKERMFEVYLNIIEWGPNVYGIGEAARFYFNKKPSELTLNESLFLATIIPRPKGFMWRFDKQGNLKDFVGRQFRFVTDKMVRRNLLMPEDTINFTHLVKIPGEAKSFIKLAPDTLLQDTMVDENGLIFGEN